MKEAERGLYGYLLKSALGQARGAMTGACLGFSWNSRKPVQLQQSVRGVSQEVRPDSIRHRSHGPWRPVKDFGFYSEHNDRRFWSV